MFAETQRLQSPTGATIAYHHSPAKGETRGILLISHGLAEHSRRYEAFADAMATQGFNVYAHDHRGHGETVAADAPIGRFARRNGVDQVMADVLAMRELAATTYPGRPIILFGHSMGGLISLNTAVTYPDKFDAVTVWNSNFHPGLAGRAAQLILKTERMFRGSDVPSGPLPKLPFGAGGKSTPNRRTEFDWLSRIPEQVDKYIADPLCGFDASVSLWLDIFELSFRAPQKAYLDQLRHDMPIHLVGGGKDSATDNGKAISWLSNHLKNAGFSHITTRIHPDMRHETLNEIGADQAIADFANWCKAVVARN